MQPENDQSLNTNTTQATQPANSTSQTPSQGVQLDEKQPPSQQTSAPPTISNNESTPTFRHDLSGPFTGTEQEVFTPYSNDNKAGKTAETFILGGSKNVSRFMRFTKASLVSYAIWLVLALCLIGMSYLHYKYGYVWLRLPFLIVTALSVVNILYFGWIRRELVFTPFRGILPENTIRGGTAVAYSFFYLASIAIIAGIGWNVKPNYNHNNSAAQTTQTIQSSHQ